MIPAATLGVGILIPGILTDCCHSSSGQVLPAGTVYNAVRRINFILINIELILF